MAIIRKWRKATEEEIAQGLDNPSNAGMILIEEEIIAQDITEYKQYLCNRLDEKTQEVISQGFTFDGIVFSLSQNAQINISNIPNLPEQAFPFAYLGKEDEFYELSFANKMNFYFTALSVVKNTRIANGAIKVQVKACTTTEELDVIRTQHSL